MVIGRHILVAITTVRAVKIIGMGAIVVTVVVTAVIVVTVMMTLTQRTRVAIDIRAMTKKV